MANVNTINLGGLSNADLQAQQLELQRRQQIADAIRQQSLEPLQTQMAGKLAIPISPWEGLSKIGQAYLANRANKDIQQKQVELGTEASKRAAAALRAMAPPGTFDTPTASNPDFSTTPDFSMQSAGQAPQAQGMPQSQSQGMPASDSIKQAWIRAISVYQTDPELGRKMIGDISQVTTEQKDMAAKGIDPKLAGALAIAKMRKEGIIEYQPGTTAQDLATGQERFQPTLAPGISLQNGQASAIPGFAQAQGQISGAQTAANKAAELPYQAPTTVQTPQGPRLMTPQQQIAAAQGQNGQPGMALKTPAQQKFEEDQAAAASKEMTGINDRVRNSTQLMMNVNESRQALKDFVAGGGKETRAKLASMAQAVGMPQTTVDKIAGGDLGAMQEFKKIAAQQAMEALKSAMATDTSAGGRITQAEFKIFQDVNPNLSTDPRAIEKLYSFIEKQHNRNVEEQQQANQFIQQGGNPAGWSAEWTRRLAQPQTQNSTIDDLLKKYGGQ